MAPRLLETPEALLARLAQAADGGAREIRFGGHHHTHAVCFEAGCWRLRRLVLDPHAADAFLKVHGRFMPEDAEALSEPGGDVLLEAPTMALLIERLRPLLPLA